MKQIGFSINEEKEYEKEEKAYAPKEEDAKLKLQYDYNKVTPESLKPSGVILLY